MSLANRLSAFFLVAVALLLGGFSVTLYLLARSHLHRDLDERLVNLLDQMAAAVVDNPGSVDWKVGAWKPALGVHPEGELDRWAVFDPDGTILDRSWEFARAEGNRIACLTPLDGHAHESYEDLDGHRWRLALRSVQAAPLSLARPLPSDDDDEEYDRAMGSPSSGRPRLLLATGKPLRDVEATLRKVVLGLISSSTALWLVAAVAGRAACRRALRPMVRMSTVARGMSASDAAQHLPSPGTHDELEDLAIAFNGLLGRLHEALERQKQFTGDASHQLRTPLTALIGEIEVARRRERSTDEYRRVLDDAHVESLHLRQIVESLLFLARAEAEAGLPDLQPIDLTTWLPGHLQNWSDRDRGRDIQAEAIPGVPLWVRAHPPLLGQLVDNLLENAAKYSEAGSRIVVRLGREPGFATLAVEDHGFGLAPEDAPRIFEPFYRSEQARKMGRPGVGLGLAVVRRIAEAFGGTIHAEATSDRGTRFLARFPDVTPDSACSVY